MFRRFASLCVIFTQLAPQEEAMKRIQNLIEASIYCVLYSQASLNLCKVGVSVQWAPEHKKADTHCRQKANFSQSLKAYNLKENDENTPKGLRTCTTAKNSFSG